MGRKELFGFALLLGLACGVVRCQVCPQPEDISPCTCKQYPMPSLTTCSNITDLDTLYEIFGKSFDIPIIYFILENSNVQYLPATSVSGKKFQTIQYQNSALTALFDGQPEPTDDLHEVRVYNVRLLRGIQWGFFSAFTNLSRIDVRDTEVKKLGQDFRDNAGSKIEYLKFSNSKTVLLEDGVFDRLTEATWIQVTSAKVPELKRNMFPQTNKIWLLDFSGNQLKTLPEDLFNNMPELQIVNLIDNQLTSIPEEVYGDWYRRTEISLDLHSNPLVCDCKVRWIIPNLPFRSITGNCTDPPSLKGKLLIALEPSDFNSCNAAYWGN